MRHAIDPKVDCVFKALLGSPENSNLLVNFINAMLGDYLPSPVEAVEILNPYNEREFLNDKLSIVDIKAQDTQKQLFQIEIQLATYPSLPVRILYNWADIYSQQLKSGEDYTELKPSYAIWLLNENIHDDEDYCHHFKMRDEKGRSLSGHAHITVLELKKFQQQAIDNNQARWLSFFNQAENFDDQHLPVWMNTKEMEQAMSTLSLFSEKDRAYFAYQARQDYIREQKTLKVEQAKLELEKNKALTLLDSTTEKLDSTKEKLNLTTDALNSTTEKLDSTTAEKNQALAELAKLKALLKQQ